MNVLICDDLPEDARRLESLLRASGYEVHTRVFLNGLDALRYANTSAAIDVCFLDIVMPDMSGIELAAELREGGYAGRIIFLSTSNEYGPESYEVSAFSYLRKPPTPEKVRAVMERLAGEREKTDRAAIALKSPGIAKTLLLRDVAYVEVTQHKVHFALSDGTETAVYMSLKEVAEKLLSDKRFVQSHRSYIVNMEYISEISESEILMRGGERIPVTRTYRDVRNKYYRWAFGGDRT
jgi:DNA-binding LytR/AlgR family response regulator